MTAAERSGPDAAFRTAFREAMAELADPPAVTPVSAEEPGAGRQAEAEAGL
jgi:hypothetical protein